MRSAPTAAAVSLLLAIAAPAQEEPLPPQPEAPEQLPEPVQAEDLTDDVRVALGRRAAGALGARKVIPAVVVVPDPASYAEAIGFWTPETIYPVLIDDGSWAAGEDIARFVRGYRPEQVVRWKAAARDARPGGPMRPRRAVPRARELAEMALARSWGADEGTPDPAQTMISRWVFLERPPPGVIIADERDPAWTAALALAAGRGQPIMWAALPKLTVDAPMTVTEAEAFVAEIERFCEQTRLPWREPGDVIDAVTICASLPVRVQTSPEEFVAFTDRLGRMDNQRRWGWAGQVFGSEPEAAYRAMCSLFLRIETAWLFDGYGSTQPWLQWDCTMAADILKRSGVFTMLDDEPRNTLRDWRLRAERPVRADLILVNSSGNRSWFELPGQRGLAGDAPFLDAPSAMHMVHSWSAVAPGRRVTIAGRLLERGVYAYVGSVHEPFLQAFVPTPILAERLVAGMALAPAARVDSGPVWRITVLADPLIAMRPPSERVDEALPLGGDRSVEEEMKRAATESRYAEAIAALALLGRDSDAARLFGAVLREKPEALDADLARVSLFSLFRTGQDDEFLRAYAALPDDLASDGLAVDALWMVGRRVVREGGTFREAAVALMTKHIREEQKAADAQELQQLGAGRP